MTSRFFVAGLREYLDEWRLWWKQWAWKAAEFDGLLGEADREALSFYLSYFCGIPGADLLFAGELRDRLHLLGESDQVTLLRKLSMIHRAVEWIQRARWEDEQGHGATNRTQF